MQSPHEFFSNDRRTAEQITLNFLYFVGCPLRNFSKMISSGRIRSGYVWLIDRDVFFLIRSTTLSGGQIVRGFDQKITTCDI